MKSILLHLGKLGRRLFPAGSFLPVTVGHLEGFFLRIGLVVLTFWSTWEATKYDRQERPAGLGQWIDFSFLGQPHVHPWFLTVLAAGALLYLVGALSKKWSTRLTLLGVSVMALCHLGYWTLRNSQGNTFHGSNLTTMVLLWQVGVAGIQLYREKKHLSDTLRWTGLDGMLLYASQCAIAGSYVASGITKIARTQGRWVLDSHLFAKSVQKVWRQHYYDDPTVSTFAGVSPWAEWLLAHPIMARCMFGPGFFLEVFAFLMLASRRWALAIGASLIAMHFFIEKIMQLEFPEWQALSLVFGVNLPFWCGLAFKAKAPLEGRPVR